MNKQGGRIAIMLWGLLSTHAFSNENSFEYDSSFFSLGSAFDIKQFSKAEFIPKGVYYSSVYLNSHFLTNNNIEIKTDEFGASFPCVSASLLKSIDFDHKYLPKPFSEILMSNDSCVDLKAYIPDSKLIYDISSTQLTIQIPQLYLERTLAGYVPPSLWDSGISALSVSYNINAYNYENGQSVNGYFTAGTGIGSWYLRHRGRVHWSSTTDQLEYDAYNTYLEKAIPEIAGVMQVGLTNSQGRVFGSTPILGVSLRNDNSMLPSIMQSYAPEIRGVARTNARVTVSQGDRIIYDTTVSPGEFLINDLTPMGTGGYLDVVVYETNGEEQHFSVPYEALAQQLRPGQHQYSATIGQYDNNYLLTEPLLLEATYERGLTNIITGYAGVQGNEDYFAVKAGATLGTMFGAFSFDVTQTDTRFLDSYRGQSYEGTYSKNFNSIGNSISLGAYRYSTEKYMDFQSAMYAKDNILRGFNFDENIVRSKNRYVLTISQQLWEKWGSLYFSGFRENYWNADGYYDSFNLGYNNQFGYVNFSANVNHYYNQDGEEHTSYSVGLNVPLGGPSGSNLPHLSVSHRGDKYSNGQNLSLSGSMGDEDEVNYGLSLNRSEMKNGGSSVAMGANVGYTSSVARWNASVNKGDGYSSQNINMSGGIIAHSDGVTFTPESGNTYALIKAKGAAGAKVRYHRNVSIDDNGYAAISGLNAYRTNKVSIDPSGTRSHIEFEQTSHNVVPYKNAVVSLSFNVTEGYPILIYTTYQDKHLPFAATVYDSDDNVVGNIGQGGQLYARVSSLQGKLRVSWDENKFCYLDYSLDQEQVDRGDLHIFNVSCK